MGLISSIKRFFKSALRSLWRVINSVISGALEKFLADFLDIAKDIVKTLMNADLTNEEKRKDAFSRIRNKVIAQGKDYKDSWISILIELALQAVKAEING